MKVSDKLRRAASVHDRLLPIAKKRGENFDLVLRRYALERFLYRLSVSPHRKTLVLKGAMLFELWSDTPHRATRDIDFLAEGNTDRASLESIIKDVCGISTDEDGLVFDVSKLRLTDIREESRYGGQRARFNAFLGSARIPMQIDLGIGDAVTPGPQETSYPSLLGMAKPSIMSYPRETVIAEKLETIVNLGIGNSRMKDYFDLWFLATTFSDELESIGKAVKETFMRREQDLPTDMPIGLSDEFAKDAEKQRQWQRFAKDISGAPLHLEMVVSILASFARAIFAVAKRS